MLKKVIITDKAPKAIGPYSQAIKVGSFLYTAGQLGIDPVSGKLATDIKEQTLQTLENLKVILEAGDMRMSDVVKTTIFIKDMNDFSIVNELYGGYFQDAPPARSTIQVARLPLDALVEIEMIAHND